jgi:hypothetical protein
MGQTAADRRAELRGIDRDNALRLLPRLKGAQVGGLLLARCAAEIVPAGQEQTTLQV